MSGCTCAKPGELDRDCIAHGDHPTVCYRCLGSGREWYMQGGAHGVGNYGKCEACGGTGKPQEVSDG